MILSIDLERNVSFLTVNFLEILGFKEANNNDHISIVESTKRI